MKTFVSAILMTFGIFIFMEEDLQAKLDEQDAHAAAIKDTFYHNVIIKFGNILYDLNNVNQFNEYKIVYKFIYKRELELKKIF